MSFIALSLKNCYNAGNVKVVTGYVGGIIGYDNQTTRSISRCYNNIGSVETESNDKNLMLEILLDIPKMVYSAVTGYRWKSWCITFTCSR